MYRWGTLEPLAGTLETLARTCASSSEFCYPILDETLQIPTLPPPPPPPPLS